MMLLTILAVLVIVGVAAYCMICEQLAATHSAAPATRGEIGSAASADALV